MGSIDGIKRYWGYFSHDAMGLAVAAILLTVNGVLPALAVLLVERSFHTMSANSSVSQLFVVSFGFAALYLLSGVCSLWRVRFTKEMAWRAAAALRTTLHQRYLAVARTDEDLGEQISALTTEVDDLQYGVSALVTLVRSPISILGLLSGAVYMAPRLALWTALFLPVFIAVSRWSGRRLRESSSRARTAREALNSMLSEQLLGLDVIRDFVAFDDEARRFAECNQGDFEARVEQEVDRVLPGLAVRAVGSIGIALLLCLGALDIRSGALDAGQLLAFVTALGLLLKPVSNLAEVWGLWNRSMASLERVHAVLDRPVNALKPPSLTGSSEGLTIHFEDSCVGYGERTVAGPLTHTITPGAWVAIAGVSGAGKSTLLATMLGELPPVRGRVEYVMSPEYWFESHEWFSVVRQEDYLFSRSVLENLTVGSHSPSEERAWAALADAGAAGFVRDLALGIHHRVGERGDELSGGERQRLCLARALYRKTPVLVLDEPTNQLDKDSTEGILITLQRLRGQRTIVCVAHDTVLTNLADFVLFIGPRGEVVVGTHTHLYASNSDYRAWAGRTGGHLDAGGNVVSFG